MNVIQEITNVILNAPPNATVPFWNIKPIQFNKIKILIKIAASENYKKHAQLFKQKSIELELVGYLTWKHIG